jgi:hypothetical protein
MGDTLNYCTIRINALRKTDKGLNSLLETRLITRNVQPTDSIGDESLCHHEPNTRCTASNQRVASLNVKQFCRGEVHRGVSQG